jgi:O-methyltransferase involved in polyketide biosynthesis
MASKLSIDLGNVQKTLLLPLWGRAVESRKKDPLMADPLAAQMVQRIDFDFSTIAKNMSRITQLAWIVRSLHIDLCVRRFLQEFPKASIVNIGCGLDTTFERVDNGTLAWYDMDLPDVIEMRKELIGESMRRKFLSCSFLADEWIRRIPHNEGILLIAAGVLYYFDESELKNFFGRMADAFPKGEMIFDAASPLGIRVANKKVIERGGMDQSAVLKWGLDNAEEIRRWDDRILILEEYPIFRGMKKKMNLRDKIGTSFSDFLEIMSMVHLRFSA